MVASGRSAIVTGLMLGLIALAAPSAGASVFAAEGYPAQLSGEQTEQVTIGSEAGTIKCSETTVSGTLEEGPNGAVALTPTFKSCTAFGIAATIVVNGCQLVGHSGAETGSEIFAGTMDVTCPAEKAIVITTATCEMQIGPQTGLSSLTLTDETGGTRKVGVGFGLTGVAYTVTKDGAFCPFSGTGAKTNGTMGGKVSFGGTWKKAATGVFVIPQATIMCETEGGEECLQEALFPFKMPAVAPTAKIVLGAITVDCETSKLELEGIGTRFNGDAVLVGLEWNFIVKKCKTAVVPACGTVSSEPNFLTYMHPLGKGKAEWLGESIKLNIVCGAQVNCRYKKAKPITFTGGKPAGFEAKDTGLEQEKIPGEAGCVAEAKLTGTFAVGDIAFFDKKG
jgi:hypothetical protein